MWLLLPIYHSLFVGYCWEPTYLVVFGLAYYQGKDVVFRFIIEYSSLRDFAPSVIGLFLCDELQKMISWLVLKLELSHRLIIS
jgi:hypothetical protein